MLTARLKARCPSAVPFGPAMAKDYAFIYGKKGMDGTSKATLVAQPGAEAHGVLFRLAREDLPLLDRFEGVGRGYDRHDDFSVISSFDHTSCIASTYIAPAEFIDPTLLPFDWYHALVLAGAREHGLPGHYVAGRIVEDRATLADSHSPAARHAREIIEKTQKFHT